MRFRRLVIRLQTTDGPYGTTLDFADGLSVVWADNSMGKSTCVKSILVALGMEAMLTTSQSDLPLPPAVKSRLESERGEHDVLESEVLLEIENSTGRRLVAQRMIKGPRDKNLITVYEGPALTDPEATFPSQDFYVNRAGAATRQLGFHSFLANFLGWELPKVQTFEGNAHPLYLQCIFPYLVVEQTRGWSTIQPPLPTQFRIRDVHKRSVEFLLNLDAHRVALRRQELLLEKTRIEFDWRAQVTQISDFVESHGVLLRSLPDQPTTFWPPAVPPSLAVPNDETWISLAERLSARETELVELVEQEIPRVQEIAAAAQTDLAQTERDASEKQVLLSRLLDSLQAEQEEVRRIENRLKAIEEDIQRSKDVQTLKKLGSRQESTLDAGNCPVCHQSIQDSLLPLAREQTVMTLDENIDFLREQKRTFEIVLENGRSVADARSSQIFALESELGELRTRVRALRQTLLSDGRLPSVAAIRARFELENAIRTDKQVLERFDKSMEKLGELAKLWGSVLAELGALPKSDVTETDAKKIAVWTRLIREQLKDYEFRSLRTEQVIVSPDTYRPEHEGFDLQTSLSAQGAGPKTFSLQTSVSASDIIRTIWSYLHGILELARAGGTNHPGFIIFDEPRQQSTRDLSFLALLKRASKATETHQQVIFFTSEDFQRLTLQLAQVQHSLYKFEGRVLQRRKPSLGRL